MHRFACLLTSFWKLASACSGTEPTMDSPLKYPGLRLAQPCDVDKIRAHLAIHTQRMTGFWPRPAIYQGTSCSKKLMYAHVFVYTKSAPIYHVTHYEQPEQYLHMCILACQCDCHFKAIVAATVYNLPTAGDRLPPSLIDSWDAHPCSARMQYRS